MKYAELVRATFHLTDIILHHLQILVLNQVTLQLALGSITFVYYQSRM